MNSEKVLILGGTGMLGHKLVQVFSERFDTRYTIRGEWSEIKQFGIFPRDSVVQNVDARDFSSVRSAIQTTKPSVVVNAIGIIKQLQSSRNVVETLTINSILPQLLSDLASEQMFRLITLSTDCVFSGSTGFYNELDVPDTTELYGRSKQYGEVTGKNCLTLRTSIIGREIRSAHSLLEWFLSQSGSVKGYKNAIYSGFPTILLAELIADLIDHHPTLEGLFHVSSEPISKCGLLMLAKRRLGISIEIEEFEDFFCDRSLDSSRFRQATGFNPLPWVQMVDRMFSDSTPYDEWHKTSLI